MSTEMQQIRLRINLWLAIILYRMLALWNNLADKAFLAESWYLQASDDNLADPVLQTIAKA